MDEIKTIETMGLTLPEPSYLFGAILFGIIGYAAYRYGKKSSRAITKWIGVALMLYPYAISNTVALYAVGIILCIGLYFSHR